MIASIGNGLAILLGAGVGLATRCQVPAYRQKQLRVLLGAFLVFAGLALTWSGIHGPFRTGLRQCAVILLSLMLGRFTGSLLGVQQLSNRAGRAANRALERAEGGEPIRFGEGFSACTLLFALAPLALVGPIADGLRADWRPLAAKTLMDGLAAVSFARAFGRSVIASALPVVVWQGTWFLVARRLEPWLADRALVDPVAGVAGMIVFMVALVVLGISRIRLADYLPSLFYAPLLTWAFSL